MYTTTLHYMGKLNKRDAADRMGQTFSLPEPGRRRLHKAVANLVDQRRRERRLIQTAPADSATKTPIHPAKRSSEDRCIVSGSSI